MSAVLKLRAHAKLNLFLRILGRRADGYHLLQSLLQPLQLHDDLYVARAGSGMQLRVTAERSRAMVDAGPDNLVLRALRAVAEAAGYPDGFRCHLHKRVPAGAGLGGGSSDAAAALRLGNALLGEPLSGAALAAIAVQLGADVPFFLCGGPQVAHGIGEQLQSCDVPPMYFLLLVPPYGCPTAEVYKTYAAELNRGGQQASILAVSVPELRDSILRGGLVNDLEAAAERVRPELAALRRRVEGSGFPSSGYPTVRMAGSGSTLFLTLPCADDLAAATTQLGGLRADGIELLGTASGPPLLEPPEPARWPEGFV